MKENVTSHRVMCVKTWGSHGLVQFVKIKEDRVLSKAVSIIETPSAGGPQKTSMLPISMLSGWLFTIKKVAPELQAQLDMYRAEGFNALDKWFRQGMRKDSKGTH